MVHQKLVEETILEYETELREHISKLCEIREGWDADEWWHKKYPIIITPQSTTPEIVEQLSDVFKKDSEYLEAVADTEIWISLEDCGLRIVKDENRNITFLQRLYGVE